MKLAKITLTFLITAILIMTIPLHLALAAEPTEPHNADSMWIEPSEKNVSELSVGQKFNVTVWINLTVECGGWQFKLIYDKTYLNATGCGYTAGAKSDFFSNITTFSPPDGPIFEPYNASHNFVVWGESWFGGDPRGPGYGSLSWVEFQVMAEMTVLPVTLDIKQSYHPNTSDTYAIDFDGVEIVLNVFNAVIIPEFIPLLILVILSTITVVAVFASKVLRPKLDKTSIKQ